MPANLNALIRYKTINSCLYGGKRRWTIHELRDACSEALAESRGRYEPVSERTLRDDIRVLRSDILGFNAPISQKGGMYYYADPHFSILSLNITDAGLADKVFDFLLRLRTEVLHPELETILEQLCKLTGKPYELPVMMERPKLETPLEIAESRHMVNKQESYLNSLIKGEHMLSDERLTRFSIRMDSLFRAKTESIPKVTDPSLAKKSGISWGDVFARIT